MMAAPAWACGGFFCDGTQGTPGVSQAGEIVVFGQDGEEVTAHISIAYEGPADEFAWVVPVPAEPTLELSSQVLFDQLQATTQHRVRLQQIVEGCASPSAADADTDSDTDSDADVDTDGFDTGIGGVTVVSEQQVGPYDSAVLLAEDGTALVDWLQANKYGVPDTFADAVSPYLAPGMHFLALRLSKGNDTGDLAPVSLSYTARQMSIPLQLTAVAATPDMPVTVYVLGEQRAVPLSYLHVQLNPVYWFVDGFGSMDDTIAGAVDEAGGRAFVTLYSDPHGIQLRAITMPLQSLSEHATAADFVFGLQQGAWLAEPGVVGVLLDHLPPPEGITPAYFYGCPKCFEEEYAAFVEFDAVAVTEDLRERVVRPATRAQRMLNGGPVATRMQTALSPEEMTVDPVFAFNPDLPRVAADRSILLSTRCLDDSQLIEDGPRYLLLPGGYEVPVPVSSDAIPIGSWLEERVDYRRAMVVEQLSETGEGSVLVDHSADLVWPAPFDETWVGPIGRYAGGGACGGCQSGPAFPTGMSMLVLLGVLSRRRRG